MVSVAASSIWQQEAVRDLRMQKPKMLSVLHLEKKFKGLGGGLINDMAVAQAWGTSSAPRTHIKLQCGTWCAYSLRVGR